MNAITENFAEQDDQDRLILDSVDRFLERHVRPVAMQLEHDDIYPREIVDRMKDMGLFGAVIPAEYGGLGLSARTYARVIERISTVWMSVAGIINSHLIMATIVNKSGTEAQKRAFLPRFAIRRTARRPGADRARCRNRPAGHPHYRPARRR